MDGIQTFGTKICAICGDEANVYNFGVLSCESCKAFFRRNATRDVRFKCPYENECEISVGTRRFCRKCRLDKCFAVGMNKLWIMSEEEKQIRFCKLYRNRVNNNLHNGNNVPYPGNTSSATIRSTNFKQFTHNVNPKPQACVRTMPQQPVSIPTTKPCHIPVLSTDSHMCEDTLSISEEEGMYIDTSWHNSIYLQDLPSVESWLDENLRQPGNIISEKHSLLAHANNCHSIINNVKMNLSEKRCEESEDSCAKNDIICKTWQHSADAKTLEIALSAEYSYLANETGLRFFGSKVLTTIEAQKINELIKANSFSVCFPRKTSDDQLFCEKIHDIYLIDSKETDNLIRLLIKSSKKITAFKNTCVEDQITLLKGGFPEISVLLSVIMYDSEIDGWKCPEHSIWIKVNQFKEFNNGDYNYEKNAHLYDKLIQYIQSFDPVWKNDEIIILILITIVLLTPTRPNILHPQVLEKELYSYYFLLQRYLECKYSRCNARVQFMRLIQTVQEIKKYSTSLRKLLMTVKPKHYGQLATEILDL